MTAAISLHALTKRYRAFTAVDDITLDIEPGSICGLLGPNGAGKTTTFKCLLGFTQPTTGTVTIEGKPIAPETFETLAYVPERAVLWDSLTVGQHLEVYRRLYRSYDGGRARELLDRFSLDPRKPAKRLSKGMRSALAITLAFSIRPRVLILDEPSSGLDPIHQRHVLDLMIDAAAGEATVLFSSHNVGQVERAADRVAILNKGRLIVNSTIDDLKTDEKIVEAVFAAEPPALNGLADDPRVVRIDVVGSTLRAVTRGDSDEIAQRIFALHPRSIRTIDLNLEEIFLNAVAGDQRS
jgi:ABC-2 type transport system ATP-binding protein